MSNEIKGNTYFACAAAVAAVVSVKFVRDARSKRRRKTEEAAANLKFAKDVQAYHVAAERVRESIQTGQFNPDYLAEIQTAFDFESIAVFNEL